jgi:hypothetical protein
MAVRTATAQGVNGSATKPTSAVALQQAGNVGVLIVRGSAKLLAVVASGINAGSSRLSHLAASSPSFEATSLIVFGAVFLAVAFIIRRTRTSTPEA